jgi:predicted branched-subunit amino acid permease
LKFGASDILKRNILEFTINTVSTIADIGVPAINLGSLVTDETFGVAITPYLKGEAINDRWMHGLNITSFSF